MQTGYSTEKQEAPVTAGRTHEQLYSTGTEGRAEEAETRCPGIGVLRELSEPHPRPQAVL